MVGLGWKDYRSNWRHKTWDIRLFLHRLYGGLFYRSLLLCIPSLLLVISLCLRNISIINIFLRYWNAIECRLILQYFRCRSLPLDLLFSQVGALYQTHNSPWLLNLKPKHSKIALVAPYHRYDPVNYALISYFSFLLLHGLRIQSSWLFRLNLKWWSMKYA